MKLLSIAALLMTATPALAAYIPPVEVVYAVSAGPDGVTVRLKASCTTRQDLAVAIAKSPRVTILIARRHPDVCNGSGHADVVFKYEELGLQPGQPFSVANPIAAEPQ